MDVTVHMRPLQVLLVGGDGDDAARVRADLALPHFNVTVVPPGGEIDSFLSPGEVDILLVRMRGVRSPTPPVTVLDIPMVALTDASGVDARMLALEAGAVEQVGMDELGTTVLVRVLRFALERHRLEAELRRMAHADPLTGLRNRRYLSKHLATAMASSRRHGHPLSIAVCDLDNFKVVNDTYGHTVGDEVLKAVATVLRDGVRSEDAVARFGGDEFCLVFPHVGAAEAARAVERIRCAVENLALRVGDVAVPVSATFGIAQLSADMSSSQALFDAADRALIIAKQGGRNRSAMAR